MLVPSRLYGKHLKRELYHTPFLPSLSLSWQRPSEKHGHSTVVKILLGHGIDSMIDVFERSSIRTAVLYERIYNRQGFVWQQYLGILHLKWGS